VNKKEERHKGNGEEGTIRATRGKSWEKILCILKGNMHFLEHLPKMGYPFWGCRWVLEKIQENEEGGQMDAWGMITKPWGEFAALLGVRQGKEGKYILLNGRKGPL